MALFLPNILIISLESTHTSLTFVICLSVAVPSCNLLVIAGSWRCVPSVWSAVMLHWLEQLLANL